MAVTLAGIATSDIRLYVQPRGSAWQSVSQPAVIQPVTSFNPFSTWCSHLFPECL